MMQVLNRAAPRFGLRGAIIPILFVCATAAGFSVYKSMLSLGIQYPSALPAGLASVIGAAVLLARVSYEGYSPAFKVLFRGLGALLGLYTILGHPNFPISAHDYHGWARHILNAAWLASIVGAILAYFRPAFLIVPAFYIYWVKGIAGHLTGLPFHTWLDVNPLIDVAGLAAIGFFVLATVSGDSPIGGRQSLIQPIFEKVRKDRRALADLIVFLAVPIQMANYFFSAVAKIQLDGGPLSWVMENDLRSIFSIAVLNEQLIWQDIQGAAALIYDLITPFIIPISVTILFFQAAAITIFISRSWAILVFAFLDLMHLGIFLLVGANFVTWFLLNVAIIAALRALPESFFSPRMAILGAGFGLVAPLAAWEARLAWYDTPAVNQAFFFAVDESGHELRVPATFFGFYSYPIAHMSFPFPQGRYVPTTTNGGTKSWTVLQAARNCAFSDEALAVSPARVQDSERVTRFIKAHHTRMLTLVDDEGRVGYDWYLHHFWATPSVSRKFYEMDKRKIVAYILRIEAICARIEGGRFLKHQVTTNEFRIPVAGRQ